MDLAGSRARKTHIKLMREMVGVTGFEEEEERGSMREE